MTPLEKTIAALKKAQEMGVPPSWLQKEAKDYFRRECGRLALAKFRAMVNT